MPEPFHADKDKPSRPHLSGLFDDQIVAMNPVVPIASALNGIEYRLDGPDLEWPEDERPSFTPAPEGVELDDNRVDIDADVGSTSFLEAPLIGWIAGTFL